MRDCFGILVAALLGPAAVAAQTGQFVVLIGHDTLAIEQYTRAGNRLQGEQVVRSPVTVHRLYTATFGPGGTAKRCELVTHNVTGGPGPRDSEATADFRGDSAIVTLPQGDSIATRRVKLGRTTVPYVLQGFAMVEEVARRARAADGDSYATSMLPLGTSEVWDVTVTRRGDDSMTIMIGPIGPLRLRVDRQGNLLGASGVGGTMQVTVERAQGLDFASLGRSFAQRPLGALSPADSVTATVAGATLVVHYSRPSARGRVVFGGMVPWNQVWRTGANAATVFETSADLVVAGTTLPAGKYTLWTLPSPTGWKLIINRNTGQWGTDYDSRYDFARLDMKVDPLTQPVEQFTIAVEPRDKGGVLQLEWETTRAWVPFSRK